MICRRVLLPVFSVVLGPVLLLFLVGLPSSAQAQELESCSVEWEIPDKRENGDDLPREEIGGYELRVTGPSAELQKYLIEDPDAEGFTIEDCVPGQYVINVAVFDTDGLYSEFVELQETAGDSSRPAPPDGIEWFETLPEPCPSGDCTVIDLSSRLIIRRSGN